MLHFTSIKSGWTTEAIGKYSPTLCNCRSLPKRPPNRELDTFWMRRAASHLLEYGFLFPVFPLEAIFIYPFPLLCVGVLSEVGDCSFHTVNLETAKFNSHGVLSSAIFVEIGVLSRLQKGNGVRLRVSQSGIIEVALLFFKLFVDLFEEQIATGKRLQWRSHGQGGDWEW